MKSPKKKAQSEPNVTMSRAELNKLKHVWRLKLKASGFEDIEEWTNGSGHNCKIIKGHIRYEWRTVEEYLERLQETEEYFWVIGTFAHHSPDVKPHYKALLIEYSEVGLLKKVCRQLNKPHGGLRNYIYKNMGKMVDFARDFQDDRE